MTFRPLNQCENCGSTWHPRGKDLSSRCPTCGSRNVGIVRSSSSRSGCAPIVVGIIGVIFVIGWFGNHSRGSSPQADSSALPAVVASAADATAASDIASDVIATLDNSSRASDAAGLTSVAGVDGASRSDGDEGSVIAASQTSLGDHVPTKTFPTSFDCAHALDDDERAICGDPGLAAMDRQLERLYGAALKTISDPQALEKSEADWLVTRKMCNQDLECLRRVYGERIGQFMGSLGSKPLIPLVGDAGKP